LPTFIVKANRAYQEMSSLHGFKNIWTVLPPEFKEASELSMASLSTLELFFRSAYLMLDEGVIQQLSHFVSSIQAWTTDNNLERYVQRGADSLNLTITKYGCKAGRAMIKRRGEQNESLMDIIVGVRLTDDGYPPLDLDSFRWV